MFSTLNEIKWRIRMLKLLVFRIWSKISVKISRLTKSYVLKILYRVVFPIIGLAGNRMALQKSPEGTSWDNWDKKNDLALISKQSGKNWLLHYLSWTLKTKNLWAIFLLPFILILKFTEQSLEGPPPELLLMYTLY